MYYIGQLFTPFTFGLVISTTILILFILFFRKSNKKYPPGPKGYPIIGNAFVFRGGNIPVKIHNLTKQYKGIYRLSVFGQNIIILGNYEVMKEAFINQGTIFSGRSQDIYIFKWWHKDKGLILTDGKLWKEHQRFCHSTLRSFGMGRRIIDDIIQEEILFMLSYIDNQNRSLNTSAKPPLFSLVLANIILKLIANIRTDYQDELLGNLLNDISVFEKALRLDNPVNILPILRFIHPEFKVFTKAVSKLQTFINGLIDNHIQHYNDDNISDYIDAYLQRMKEEEENKVLMSSFTREQLIYTIEDLFLAAIETTAVTLQWMILFMIHFPNIQKKIQAEIDTVVGRGRNPTWEDKQNLPYTEATILEVQRMGNITTLGIPHKALEEGQVDGYEIPKGSIIIADMTSIHYDPMYWPEPNKFDPTRFLDKEGNVRKCVNSFAPFSIGPRSCLGESLAKMELFILFSSLLHRFTLSSPLGEEPSDLVPQTNGALSVPLPFNVCAKPRAF